MPPPGPANITDLATGTRNLDKEGLMSLRIAKQADDLGLNDPTKNKFLQDPDLEGIDPRETILPSGEGLELLRGVKNKELILNDVVNKIYLNAGVSENAQPVVRANAREFLNRIKDLEDPNFQAVQH